jgi:transketolase
MTTGPLSGARPSPLSFGKRRGCHYEITGVIRDTGFSVDPATLRSFERLDLVYRTLCGILYNFAPTSGHPGGSISSGRFVQSVLFNTAAYDIARPLADENDMIVYAAGHKALGLYAISALRNELVRIAGTTALPEQKMQFRFEDLLGFRRNPTQDTPLFKKFGARALDGHPASATPFVKISTGASGVGVGAAFGLALGAFEKYGKNAPKVHIVEGEGGMTPGRVAEAMAAAGTASLGNIVMHVDFNQASIDSNRVCREGDTPGDYVQWTPAELAYANDWNVITVPDGKDFTQVLAAQSLAMTLDNGQPTAIVYRTVKGWKYGMEGKASHGAGHKFCSDGYYTFAKEYESVFGVEYPRLCVEATPANIEQLYWDTLSIIRANLESEKEIAAFGAARVAAAAARLASLGRTKTAGAPNLGVLYTDAVTGADIPEALRFKTGASVTIRGALGDAMGAINKKTGGALVIAAADLLGSTSVQSASKGFPDGYFNAVTNPGSRTISLGGICEDAMGAFMAGVSAYGTNVGVSSSYGAFIAAMEHTAARLHGIGMQSRKEWYGLPYSTWIMVNAHAGLKTGEDGPTHADPQALQLLQENFPSTVMVTMVPWTPDEVWPLFVAGLKARPAVLAPFITRPNEGVIDRAKLGLPPADATVKGVYLLRKADPAKKPYHGTIVLQESGITCEFVYKVLPKIIAEGLNINLVYVSSAELFDALPKAEQAAIYTDAMAAEAMAITGFTLPTMYRWVQSRAGLDRSLHPFKHGHYLGSGPAEKVLQEAGLDGEAQWKAVLAYANEMGKRS